MKVNELQHLFSPLDRKTPKWYEKEQFQEEHYHQCRKIMSLFLSGFAFEKNSVFKTVIKLV